LTIAEMYTTVTNDQYSNKTAPGWPSSIKQSNWWRHYLLR